MVAGFVMMGCQNLAVPAEVMQHVVHVESSANPFAIGVVNGQLVRQPQNLDEALATVEMLQDKGYNFSIGLGQVNRNNLAKYGLATYKDAFQACPNLVAASQILADCYDKASGNWGNAFSCYYSGNFVSGYRDGYVQKIYESIGRSVGLSDTRSLAAAKPIPLAGVPAMRANKFNAAPPALDSAAYRVAIRSSAIDNVTASSITSAASTQTAAANTNTVPTTTPPAAVANKAANNPSDDNDIFVPKVRGPNDPALSLTNNTTFSTGVAQKAESADPTHGGGDAAFVF